MKNRYMVMGLSPEDVIYSGENSVRSEEIAIEQSKKRSDISLIRYTSLSQGSPIVTLSKVMYRAGGPINEFNESVSLPSGFLEKIVTNVDKTADTKTIDAIGG